MFRKRKVAGSQKTEDKDYGTTNLNEIDVGELRSSQKRLPVENVKGGLKETTKRHKSGFVVERKLRQSDDHAIDTATAIERSAVGPTKKAISLMNVRRNTRVDYNPEICKDYFETGYCGYGDTCIFIHDRTNYKEGWQLDKEWEEKERKEKDRHLRRMEGLSVSQESEESSALSDENEEVPHSCHICRASWPDCASPPVITICSHYFCEKCIVKHQSKSVECPICKSDLKGIFNEASEVIKRMKPKTIEDE